MSTPALLAASREITMPYVQLEARENAAPLSIRYEFIGGRTATPLVLVHEFGGSLQTFDAFASAVGQAVPIVAFDGRAAGLSEKPAAPFTLWDLAQDIERLADALSLARPFHLMGLAMGAVTALHYAVRHSREVASLVLCDGTSDINGAARQYLLDHAASVRKGGMRLVADQIFKNSFRGLPNPLQNPSWANYRQQFLGNSPDGYAMQSEALAGLNLTTDDLSKVRCRTLVLTGQHDSVWSPAVGQALASKLPNACFEIAENASHFPPLQATEQVAERVLRFLKEAP